MTEPLKNPAKRHIRGGIELALSWLLREKPSADVRTPDEMFRLIAWIGIGAAR